MKKLNNKGFSLVELIIVIAIMVILVTVIAPQYLKFVHNSRISTDVQTAADAVTAIDVAVANSESPFDTSGNFTGCSNLATTQLISKFNGGTISVTGDNINGVTKVTLSGVTNGNSKSSFELYPNPENATDGVAQDFIGVGLKK